jgi:hypothetical protein
VKRVRLFTCLALALVAVVSAVGCGAQAKSDKHAAGVCDSLKQLGESKNSMDSLDTSVHNSLPTKITSLDAVRSLARTYRKDVAAYDALAAKARAEVAKVDAGENTATIQRMWRQLAISLDQRRDGTAFFADAYAHPERFGSKEYVAAFSARAGTITDRANALSARLDSVLDAGLGNLGFERGSDGQYVIDC